MRTNAVAFETARLSSFPRSPGYALLLEKQLLAPVKVSRDRLIREVVGLRPFRPSGFVVATEKLGEKLLVHNYGHGGAGVTLSWGTASLALDLARDALAARPVRARRTTRTQFAILGCGVNGLSTARLLQQRFSDGTANVTIYAKRLPPDTTSNVAGAFWYPSSAFDSDAVAPAFSQQFLLACQTSQRAFQTLVGPEYGVNWITAYELNTDEASSRGELLGGAPLYPQTRVLTDPANYFGFPFATQFNTMIIEPHTYLRSLLRDFYVAGGKIVVREFLTRAEVAKLREPVIFNCTGLGARDLFNDEQLIPVRGQLEVLLPQPEVDYCYLAGGLYMFPRRDGIILGGTWNRRDWRLEPDPAHTTRILDGHAQLMRGAAH